ncbi:connector enhancer of ksr isoform X3 [Rhodnius prolixus]|uniref:connector enhancer of ksr isoform X3 n=1 Tax=Rhodnius prolixus TaxID=13249 RepID=UPI003D18F53E
MAYVNVAEWKPDQVTEWLKGLDNSVLGYIHSFLNNQVSGQQLLSFGTNDLEHLGVYKIGHQEIILEGIEYLRNIHYELDRENLQLLAMRLSCLAHSLHSELCHSHTDAQRLSTQILADIATIVSSVKPLIAWLDRPGFSGQLEYQSTRSEVLKLALRMATCGQRDRFAETPVTDMKDASAKLAKLADSVVQEMTDPLILQPASLDLATVKKRSSDDLGFYIVPSFRGAHQISDLKLNSAAHQSGKIEPGDEIIQINYQTVVGWDVKHVTNLFAESPTEVLLTLKKRPRHTKVYGQIYVKPYRLPSKKRATNTLAFAPRPELLTRLPFRLPLHSIKVPSSNKNETSRESRDSTSSDEEVTVQHKLVVPSKPVHRRATITGASPLSKRPPLDIHELWHDLKLEKESCAKQSTTSVVDFEERLSSVDKSPSGVSTNIPEQETNLETLTIKQKIEMFSREPKLDKQNAPPRKHQIRIHSEPLFSGKTISEANKLVKKSSKEKRPEVIITEPINKSGEDSTNDSGIHQDSSSDNDIFTCSKDAIHSDQMPLDERNEIRNIPPYKSSPEISEEHGKIVETINRHLLVDNFSDESDFHCYGQSNDINLKVIDKCIPSVPFIARENRSCSTAATCCSPSHLTSLKGELPQQSRECDSDLSRTISRVNTEDIINNKEQVSNILLQQLVPAKGNSQTAEKVGKSSLIKSSKHLPNLAKDNLNMSPLNKVKTARESPVEDNIDIYKESDITSSDVNKFNSLQDRHLRSQYKENFETASTKSYSSGDYSEHSLFGLQVDGPPQERQTLPKAGTKLNPTPPVPPPRPSLSKPPNACYRAIMAARSLGKASPKAQRKKHPLLTKRRNIAVKDFPSVECEGWLLQRCRRGSGTWNKRWCLIHSNTLYTFTTKQIGKAETLVCLPGFTVSPADEVKSRPYAFKVYHTGTMFYFAAETNFELSVWLDAISSATLGPNPNCQEIIYSESEGEDNVSNASSSNKKGPGPIPPVPAPRPPPVQQQSPMGEPSKMFGSLKKLGTRGSTSNSSSGGGSSLDRKCLRILGTGPVPVPTAQYRSYRRVHNTTTNTNRRNSVKLDIMKSS